MIINTYIVNGFLLSQSSAPTAPTASGHNRDKIGYFDLAARARDLPLGLHLAISLPTSDRGSQTQ